MNRIFYVQITHIYICTSAFWFKLRQEEEEIRAEEEKFYEAKREAARVARLQKAKEVDAKNKTAKVGKSWLGDDENEWDV